MVFIKWLNCFIDVQIDELLLAFVPFVLVAMTTSFMQLKLVQSSNVSDDALPNLLESISLDDFGRIGLTITARKESGKYVVTNVVAQIPENPKPMAPIVAVCLQKIGVRNDKISHRLDNERYHYNVSIIIINQMYLKPFNITNFI